jgi:uncharacterized membrane protein YraQ (UPF0718 family)
VSQPDPPPTPRKSIDWSMIVVTALVAAAAITVYVRDGSARFLIILAHDWALFADMLPKVLAGCLIAAFLMLILPREVVARWVGSESGLSGILIGTFFGAILPGGPFAIYPIAGAFAAIGADAGAIVAFVTSWSLLGYNRALIWELPFFGYEFIGWRMLMALPLPIVAALLARPIAKRFFAEPNPPA